MTASAGNVPTRVVRSPHFSASRCHCWAYWPSCCGCTISRTLSVSALTRRSSAASRTTFSSFSAPLASLPSSSSRSPSCRLLRRLTAPTKSGCQIAGSSGRKSSAFSARLTGQTGSCQPLASSVRACITSSSFARSAPSSPSLRCRSPLASPLSSSPRASHPRKRRRAVSSRAGASAPLRATSPTASTLGCRSRSSPPSVSRRRSPPSSSRRGTVSPSCTTRRRTTTSWGGTSPCAAATSTSIVVSSRPRGSLWCSGRLGW
mmetsp:Transcript_44057/g.122062  ORF Transcript_44057/g.122062 Transcript_44057/m.122062 type:complete len:261 (-) Transcript_44057:2371-3153(-)